MPCKNCGGRIDLSTDDNYNIDHTLVTCPQCGDVRPAIEYEREEEKDMEDTQHLQFVDTCENIDAAIFTGDTLYDPELLVKFEEYLARWQRGVAAHKAALTAEAEEPAKALCAVNGVVAWGNRLGRCLHRSHDNQCSYEAHCEHRVIG